MTKEKKIKYWKDLSNYDLETAIAMFETKRYLYVAFMCHQVIEKILKSYYSKLKDETPPFTHKLIYLAIHGGFYDSFDQQQIDFITEIEPFNIETRYPEYKERLLKRLSPNYCERLIEKTKELQQWIIEQI